VSDLSCCVRDLRDTTIPSPDDDHGPGQDVAHSREIPGFFGHVSRLGARPPRSISVTALARGDRMANLERGFRRLTLAASILLMLPFLGATIPLFLARDGPATLFG
jgi:hypothetical protein